MAQYDGSIRINTEITSKQAEKELKQLDSSIKKSASEISRLQKEMENIKTPTKQYESLQHAINTNKTELESLVEEQKRLSSKGVGKELDKEYLAASEAVKQLKSDLQEAVVAGDKDAYLGIEDRLNRAKSILQEMMSKNPRPLGDISYYYSIDKKIGDLKSNISLTESEMKKLEESGKAFTLGEGAEEKAARIKELSEQMEADTQRQSELQSALTAEEQRLADIKANATVSDQQILDLLERRRQLMQEIADLEKAGVGLGYQEYDSANQELEQINNQIRAYKDNLSTVPEKFSNMQKSAKKAFNAVAQGTKKSSGLLSTFASRLKGIALSLLIFNWISKSFNAMISGMKQGFTNFMNYSDSFANSVQSMKNAMSTLGNQFAAAFAPIVQMIIPWLTKLVSAISTAMTYVAQFIAILGGKNTFVRAKKVQDSYNKSLGGTAAAAKKAYGALARFDDLDVLQKKDDDAGAGGAGGAAGDMFEEVPVDSKFKDWLDGVLEKLKPILDYLKKLKDIFMEGFWDGLGDWEYRWEIIKDSIASIKESLIDIFTDPAVVAAADRWAQSVAYMLGSLVGSLASIGLTIAANLLGGIAQYLEQNKDRIKNFLIEWFDVRAEINYLFADLFQSIAYVFEAFASENGIRLTANLIGIFVDAFMGLGLIVDKFTRDILNLFIQPFVENKEGFRTALEGFLGVLADVAGTIKRGIDETFDKLNEVYDEHFKPFFDSVAQGLSDLVRHFLEFWNGSVQPVLESWAELFDELWTVHIQPMLNNFIELLGGLADMLKALWENILKPFVDWIIDYILPPVLTIIDEIISAVMGFVGFLADIVSAIIDSIKSIVQFLTDVFKGDWESAWNDIVESLNGSVWVKIKEAGKHFIDGLISGIKEKWETLKTQVSEIGTSIVDKFKDVLGIHSPSTVMEEQGNYITEGLLNGIASNISSILQIWNNLKEDILSTMTILANKLSSTLNSIANFFTKTWQEITLVFQTFADFLNWTVVPMWKEGWSAAENIFKSFDDMLTSIVSAITLMFDNFFNKTIRSFIDVDWKGSWENAKNIFSSFKDKISEIVEGIKSIFTSLKNKISEIIGTIKDVLESFLGTVSDIVSKVVGSIDKAGSASSQLNDKVGSNGRSASPAMAAYSAQSFAALTNDLPHLANGSVIRGGNPFIAVLGEQPGGQVNIEAPLKTIEQAVENVMSRNGYNRESVPVNINLNYDGETFARVSISDILSELGRQGYNVDVLGVT